MFIAVSAVLSRIMKGHFITFWQEKLYTFIQKLPWMIIKYDKCVHWTSSMFKSYLIAV